MRKTHDVYTEHHPRWLRTRLSPYWWLGKRSYLEFMLREVSCVFVGWFVVFLLMLFRAVGQGADQYLAFLDWSARPAVLLWNLVTLGFVVFHAVTWFNLAPQALVVRSAGKRVEDSTIVTYHFAAWAAVSALVAVILLGA